MKIVYFFLILLFQEIGDKTLRKIELEKLENSRKERKLSVKQETNRLQSEIEAYKKEIKANYMTQFDEAKAEMKKVTTTTKKYSKI